MKIKIERLCIKCDGSGEVFICYGEFENVVARCPKCKGEGFVVIDSEEEYSDNTLYKNISNKS